MWECARELCIAGDGTAAIDVDPFRFSRLKGVAPISPLSMLEPVAAFETPPRGMACFVQVAKERVHVRVAPFPWNKGLTLLRLGFGARLESQPAMVLMANFSFGFEHP